MGDSRSDIIEGLNVFRALERWGATLYAAWATREPDARLRAGHLIIAEREANHARLLAERMRALGAEPGPACVDDVLAAQLAELQDLEGFVAQLDGLKACTERDKPRMAGCQRALDRGLEAAKLSDPTTHHLLAQLYSEEKVSGAWYRHTYSELTSRRPASTALPVLEPDQVVRRAESARAVAGVAAACDAVA
jgi:rubrerythrin